MNELMSLTARVQAQSPVALMGQSVDLSVLGAWGIIIFLCQHGQERAVGHPGTMYHLTLELSSMVSYKISQHSDSFLLI